MFEIKVAWLRKGHSMDKIFLCVDVLRRFEDLLKRTSFVILKTISIVLKSLDKNIKYNTIKFVLCISIET